MHLLSLMRATASFNSWRFLVLILWHAAEIFNSLGIFKSVYEFLGIFEFGKDSFHMQTTRRDNDDTP